MEGCCAVRDVSEREPGVRICGRVHVDRVTSMMEVPGISSTLTQASIEFSETYVNDMSKHSMKGASAVTQECVLAFHLTVISFGLYTCRTLHALVYRSIRFTMRP